MKWRGKVVSGALMVAIGVTAGVSVRSSARTAGADDVTAAPSLQLYYTPPILVRPGEAARIPVHTVCVTASGHPCAASVTLGTLEAGGSWERTASRAAPGVTFDLSAPVARAAAHGGVVDFYLEATGPGGSRTALPPARSARPARFYVASEMPVVRVPAIPFGSVAHGRPVVSLPWGTGGDRAGLQVGLESPALGPTSFDVDSKGALHIADPHQGRVAVFSAGRPAGESRLTLGPQSSLAVAEDGVTFVLDAVGDDVRVRRIASGGAPGQPLSAGPGVHAEVRAVGMDAFAHVLPLDAWIQIPFQGSAPSLPEAQLVGEPIGSGIQLLAKATESFVRLGYTDGRRVWGAVELRGAERFGELALAEPDGQGGYVIVVHVWRTRPTPADQYQVILVRNARVTRTFAVANRSFTNIPPFGRFRLGPDGDLYQLTTAPSGTTIVRYELQEGDR